MIGYRSSPGTDSRWQSALLVGALLGRLSYGMNSGAGPSGLSGTAAVPPARPVVLLPTAAGIGPVPVVTNTTANAGAAVPRIQGAVYQLEGGSAPAIGGAEVEPSVSVPASGWPSSYRPVRGWCAP